MAAVLFTFTNGYAQDATSSQQPTATNQNTPMFYGDGVPGDGSNMDANGPRRPSASWFAKNGDLDPVNCIDPTTWSQGDPFDGVVYCNPDLPGGINCTQLNVVLLLDESGSILNRDGVEQVRESTLGLAEVFLGSPAFLTVVEFGTFANEIDLGGNLVTPAFLDNLENYLYDEHNGQSYNPNSIGINQPCFDKYTNWEDAFLTTLDIDPNLLLFLTDGEPSAYNVDPLNPDDVALDPNNCGAVIGGGQATFETGLERALTVANQLKVNGTHMFGLGVGNGVLVDNLQLVTGLDNFGENPDIFTADFTIGSFETLRDDIAAGLNAICGTELTVVKTADQDQVCGEEMIEFTFTVENTGGANDFTAVEVTLTDTFPSGMVPVSIVDAPIDGASISGQVFSYDIGTLDANQSITIKVLASITGSNDLYTNTAEANAVNANRVQDDASVLKTNVLTSTLVVAACETYEWMGEEYNTSGTYIEEGINENQCPTIDTLELTINVPSSSTQNETACGFYEWFLNGELIETFDEPGIYTEVGIIPGVDGECDETVTLNLEVLDAPFTEEFVSICDGEEYSPFGFGPWDETGVYDVIIPAQNEDECDGLFRVNLFVGTGTTCTTEEGISGTVEQDPNTGECFCQEGEPDPCADAGGDTDGDGVCDDEDNCVDVANPDQADDDSDGVGNVCDDCNSNDAGTSCDDGDPCTVNDVLDADCNCAGTFADADNDTVCDEEDVCPGSDDLADADGDGIPDGCDDCNSNDAGTSCDDGDPCTVNDVLDANCNCAGTYADADEDGVCDVDDACPGFDDDADEDGDGTPDGCDDCNGNLEGTSCDDGDDCTTGDVYDANCNCAGTFADTDDDGVCDAEDQCPEGDDDADADLDGVADACDLCEGDDALGDADGDGICDSDPVIVDCEDWVVYYADIVDGDLTNIYEVDFAGGNANLTLIATSEIEVHIAYNPDNNLLYAVSNADGSYRTLDPHAENPEFSEVNLIDSDEVTRVTMATFTNNNPGLNKLVIGDSSNDKFYSINVNAGNTVGVYDSYAPIEGGDIVFSQEGMPLMATKEGGGGLYVIFPDEDMEDMLIDPTLGNNVTGMAVSASNNLLISASGNSEFLIRENDGSDNGETIPVFDENGAFTFSAGDMTSGCNSSSDENEGDCQAFNTFYADHGNGISGTNLYRVTYSGSDAVLEFITNVNFQTHIAYNGEANLIYAVNANGSEFVAIDPEGVNPPATVEINGDIDQLYAVVYNPADELIYVGDDGANEIYTVDLSGNVEFYSEGNVNGGDLAIQDGIVYLVSRSSRDLYEVVEGGANILVNDNVPSHINGMAQANNATGLVVARAEFAEFVELSAADGSIVQTYDAVLNNESFTLSNGDMAAGCADADQLDCNANPGQCYAVTAVYVEGTTTPGDGDISSLRSDPNNAIGEPEGTDQLVFTSLGQGGSLTFEFGGTVPNGPDADITVVETTFNNPGCEEYPEYADVSVSVDGGVFYHIGIVCKGVNSVDISNAVDGNNNSIDLDCVNFVRVANNDELTTQNGDGFDVDGVIAIHNCPQPPVTDDAQIVEETAQNTLSSFPNPTSGPSQAVFVTSTTNRATLEVYDINGRSVATLFNQVANAGQEYRVEFDGTGFPNGIYVYRLTTETETVVEKFMIAK